MYKIKEKRKDPTVTRQIIFFFFYVTSNRLSYEQQFSY